MKSYYYRIDPVSDSNGICIVDVDNGGEQVFIPFFEIDNLISDLMKVKLKGVENKL